MEFKRCTKKQKQAPALSSSSPYVGRFTRSKSQIHRSDRVIPVSICQEKQHEQLGCLETSKSVKRTRKSIQGGDDDDDDDDGSFNQDGLMFRMPVVDLKSRRIFSPASVIVADDDDTAVAKSFENKDRVLCDDDCEIKVKREDRSLSDNIIKDNPNLCDGKSESGPNYCDAKRGREGDGAISDGVDEDSGEECVQTTPPEADVYINVRVSLVPEKPLGTGAGGGLSKFSQPNMNQRSNSATRSKLDITPSARLKVFKTPNSFSYRRLLPYLMGITKDNSFASSNDQLPKHEGGLKATSSVQVLDSLSQEMSIGKSAFESPLSEPCSTDGAILPIVELDAGIQTLTSFECTAEGCNGNMEFSGKIDKLDAARDNSNVVRGADPPVIIVRTLGLLEPLQGKPLDHPLENAEEDNRILGLHFTSDKASLNDGLSQIEASISCGLPDLSAKDVNDKTAVSDCPDEDSGEECVQTPPPDSDIFEADLTFNEGRIEEHATLMASSGGSNNCVSEPTPASVNQMNTSTFRNKVALKPCYRKRVFKTPNSYSYRRLLPYLKEIAKDDSFESIICQSPSDLEEKTTVTLVGSNSLNNSRENNDLCNAGCGSLPNVTLSLDSSNPTDRDSLDKGLSGLEPSTSGLHDSCTKGGDDKRDADSVSAELDRPDGDLGEECVQLTPNDTDVSVEAQVKANGGICEEHICLTSSNGGSRGSVHEPIAANKNQSSSTIKSEVVRKPWSGKKVFKAPNSFSYRRLLPFLKELTEDDSFESRNFQPLKLACDLEETHTVGLLDSHSPEISIVKGAPHGTLPRVVSNINGSNLALPDSTTEECLLKSKPDVCIKPCELKVAHDNASPIQGSDPSIITLWSPEVADKDSKISRLNNTTDRALRLPLLEKQSSFKRPNGGPMKGILKSCSSVRRGCRGICTCLNCASFRLNAERAFEFSRTQLIEAEEVASDLMKELSCIRAMLDNVTAADNDHGVLHINLVKEACLRTSKAEELAKARLNEMNNDLNCHTRMKDLQRPRVRFANDVVEKLNSNAGLPSN